MLPSTCSTSVSGSTCFFQRRAVIGLLVFLMLSLAVWLCQRFYKIWRQRTLGNFNHQSTESADLCTIASGDLYLSRYEGACCISDRVLRGLTGPGWTHVGVFHRDLHTGQLYVLDFGDVGVEHGSIEDRLHFYPGHIGVRRLKNPLDSQTVLHFEDLVNKVLRGHSEQQRGSITVATHQPGQFRVVRLNTDPNIDAATLVDLRQAGTGTSLFWEACVSKPADMDHSAICTDFTRVILQRLGVLPREPFDTCTHPDYYARNEDIEQVYQSVELLKHFDTNHDHNVVHCGSQHVKRVVASS